MWHSNRRARPRHPVWVGGTGHGNPRSQTLKDCLSFHFYIVQTLWGQNFLRGVLGTCPSVLGTSRGVLLPLGRLPRIHDQSVYHRLAIVQCEAVRERRDVCPREYFYGCRLTHGTLWGYTMQLFHNRRQLYKWACRGQCWNYPGQLW